ncbi:unnamed protein product [Rhizophagus irregularis]|nr:unnamed protein product [Rhizophagus irregularis]
MHRNEMNQSLYYVVNQLIQDVDVHEEESFEVTTEQLSSDILNATLNQLIKFVGSPNIREIWTIKVGNSLDIKHHVLLLQNRGYLYSYLSIVQNGIVCRHYFQVMLVYKTAFFHIQFIPSQWYDDNKDVKKAMQEPFLVADKFIQENITYNYDGFSNSNMTLCLFNQYNNEFCEDRLTIMEQKLIYEKLHGMYKKALNKALRSNSKSEQLINLLQEFTEDGKSDFEELNEINETNLEDEIIDKENVDPLMPILRNPKKRSGKERPLGTKRFKSSTEASKPKSGN